MKKFLSLFLLGFLITTSINKIISPFKENPFKLRIFHPSIPRNLLEDENKNDFEKIKQEKLTEMKIIKKPDINERLKNILNSSSRYLQDGEDLPDIKTDFIQNVEEGVKMGCSSCSHEKSGDDIIVKKEDGKELVKISMSRRDPEPGNENKDHNVTIMVDNFDYTSEFEQKKMKGLSIIESNKEHREEIKRFVSDALEDLINEEEAGNSGESKISLETVSQAVNDILGEVSASMKMVVENPEKGFMYELKAENEFQSTLAILVIYPIDENSCGINLTTHAMEEFEMQIIRELREEDKTLLREEIEKLLLNANPEKLVKIEDLTNAMNEWVGKVKSNNSVGKSCPEDLAFDDSKASSSLPGMIFLKRETGDNGFTDFVEDGNSTSNEENPDEKKSPERTVCMLNYASVSLIDIIDLPYLFFSFSNNKMLVENFIPMIAGSNTIERLKLAAEELISMNELIENKIRENIDPASGETIDDFKTFEPEELINMIEADLKKLKINIEREGLNVIAKKGDEVVLTVTEINDNVKIMFYYPSDVMKTHGESNKSLTNEFVFQNNISYDAMEIFNQTFEEFKQTLK